MRSSILLPPILLTCPSSFHFVILSGFARFLTKGVRISEGLLYVAKLEET